METTKLKKFAQYARRSLIAQVSAKLKLVLAEGSPARRENEAAVGHLEKEIARTSKDQVIERVAYTWFNRFCALRFMDLNRYTGIGVVSPANGQTQPEILAEAKMGHIDESMVQEKTRQRVFALLGGTIPSRDPQGEAYRLLLVSACNAWSRSMPFLFQRIADYTELLLPDDLLSDNSILVYTREAMGEVGSEKWEVGSGGEEARGGKWKGGIGDVEIIGWLYQFYISEKKDEVFEGLKKNKKITPENIPAATQLFTPHWIVRYLVENSLGRLWMLNRPNSRLIERMEYYIKPEQPETDFLRITGPEEIRLCDPASGSGHMLVYAFDLLYAIYEEEGYEPKDIPVKILTHNLYGIEIDERAGELAAFALTMKARQYDKRFLSRAATSGKSILPNICVLQNVQFQGDELKKYMDFVGRDLFNPKLITTLHQFAEADNFGSLIRPEATDVQGVLGKLKTKDVSRDAFLHLTHTKVLRALQQAEYLNQRYHVVVANPPYMGKRNMNARLAKWLKANYENVKTDLFASFFICCSKLVVNDGYSGIMSPNVWMYLTTYEHMRTLICNDLSLQNLVELPLSAFKGATVQICAYCFVKNKISNKYANFIRLVDLNGFDEEMSDYVRKAIKGNSCDLIFRKSVSDFSKIPGIPFAYWINEKTLNLFEQPSIGSKKDINALVGLFTCNNDLFMRRWHEIRFDQMNTIHNSDERFIDKKWVPYNKGGSYRKWFGNLEYVVNYYGNGFLIKEYRRISGQSYALPGEENYFKPGLTWTDFTSGLFSTRYMPPGCIYDISGHAATFSSPSDLNKILCYTNTRFIAGLTKVINTTAHFQVGDFKRLPYPSLIPTFHDTPTTLISMSKMDWDSYETSWDFTTQPLLQIEYRQTLLQITYTKLRAHWQEMTLEMQRLEEENNRIFIEAYGLQDELTPEVPLKEITLTCNPHYRYGGDKTEEELEALLLADTMKEFISYSVGCMFGRYSLDKPGLILANQGEGILEFRRKIFDLEEEDDPGLDDQSKIENLKSKISFPPDVDNVIPILDGDWFPEDVTERFRKFLRVTFGEEQYEENLEFIEKAIGKDLRKYFLKDFYADHVRRYKKRPIYWLFTSPKGSFNALIYMHRYRPDTVSVVLNDYLREFRTKLQSRLEHLKQVEASADASKAEKTKAIKEIEALKKTIDELDAYERDTLYPLATQQIQIDLDDGVKVNYPKFGAALKKIPGLEGKEEG